MWLSPNECEALSLSLSVALRSVLLSLPLAIFLAWILTRRRFIGRTLLDAVVHLPLVLPPVAVGYLLLLLFGTRGIYRRMAAPRLRRGTHIHPQRCSARHRRHVLSADGARDPHFAGGRRPRLRGCRAHARGGRPSTASLSITLPLMLPGILAGAITAFSAGLGEFGAVITFVSNIPGETRTLPLALYSALQVPGGEHAAARLATLSIGLGLGGLLLSEWFARRVRRMLGR